MALGLAVVGLASLLGCAWIATEVVTGAAGAVGRWMAGLGEMSWWTGTEWQRFEPADTRRRHWGPSDVFLTPAWKGVAPGLAVADLRLRRSPNPQPVDVVIAQVDPTQWRFRVVGAPDWTARTVAEFARDENFTVAVNAGYFTEDGPLGLVVTDGVRRHRQAAHRAAHFLVDGPGRVPRIRNEKRAGVEGVDQGFQGFPAVMTEGRTFAYLRLGGRGFDVWEVDRRTAACVTRDNLVLLLATDTLANGLSFDELATVLGGLGCRDALALDGGSSTALSITAPGHERVVPGLKPVRVVMGLVPL